MPNVTLMSKIIKNGDAQSVTKTLDVIRANAPKGQKKTNLRMNLENALQLNG